MSHNPNESPLPYDPNSRPEDILLDLGETREQSFESKSLMDTGITLEHIDVAIMSEALKQAEGIPTELSCAVTADKFLIELSASKKEQDKAQKDTLTTILCTWILTKAVAAQTGYETKSSQSSSAPRFFMPKNSSQRWL